MAATSRFLGDGALRLMRTHHGTSREPLEIELQQAFKVRFTQMSDPRVQR